MNKKEDPNRDSGLLISADAGKSVLRIFAACPRLALGALFDYLE
jgi:hypothetical protein